MSSEVLASWVRAKLSRKKRVKKRLVVPEFLPGQRRLPKPTLAQVDREREEVAAKRIFRIGKGDDE